MDFKHEKRVEATNLADVLHLVMQHSSGWYLEHLCQLLQVSSSCRQALQQARGQCEVFLPFWDKFDLQTKSTLQGFIEWLPSHTGLVSKILWGQPEDCESPEQRQELQLLQRHLAVGLQLCRANATNNQPLPLQLTAAHFHNSWPEPQLLRELAAAGVQELELSRVRQEPAQLLPSFFACFATMSSLQRLSIQGSAGAERDVVHSAGFMSAVQQLTALTSLELGVVPADAAHQLPPQLQGLTVAIAAGSDGSTAVSLSHLAALRQLNCVAAGEGLEVLLPPNITRLEVQMEGRVCRTSGAAALQEADVEDFTGTNVDVLAHLCSQPFLTSLTVRDSTFSTAAASKMAAAALGSATALTRLELFNVGFTGGTGLSRQLAKLPRLTDLHMWFCSMSKDCTDWVGLTALTSLTSLNLTGYESEPDDVAAALVAHNLTGLRMLRLESSSISSLALLPVVGALTRLSSLRLSGGERFVVGPDELMLLSSLTGLELLAVRYLQCSEAEQQRFLAGMPHLERIKPF